MDNQDAHLNGGASARESRLLKLDMERLDSVIRKVQEHKREKQRRQRLPGRQRTSGKDRVQSALAELVEEQEQDLEELDEPEILGYLTQEELEAGKSFNGNPSRYHVLKAERARLRKERRELRERQLEQRALNQVQFPSTDTDGYDATSVLSEDDVDDLPDQIILSLAGRRAAQLAGSGAVAPAYADIPDADMGVDEVCSSEERHVVIDLGDNESRAELLSRAGTQTVDDEDTSTTRTLDAPRKVRLLVAPDMPEAPEATGEQSAWSMQSHARSTNSRTRSNAPYSMMSALPSVSSSSSDELFDYEGAEEAWYGTDADGVEIGLKKPLVLWTDEEMRVTIPAFLLEYVEELEKQDRDASHYLGSIDSLFMTRGLVRNLSKPTFFPKERLRIFWYQLVGMLSFVLYQLAIVLCRVLTYPDTSLTWLQYVFYGGMSTAVCLPLAGYTYYKTHRYYLVDKRGDDAEELGPWVLYALQLFVPLPLGIRRFVYNSHGPQWPWMSFFIIFSWLFMYVITGPFGFDAHIARDTYCVGNSITFGGTMANFFHANWLHLLSNCVILLMFASITESVYGAWRTYLPVVIALPLIQPMYGFCLSVGGSAVWGLLAGAFVGNWFATLHWGANFNPWFPTVNFTRAFTLVWILNCLNILGDVQASVNGSPRISNWVHASAQLMGFLLALVFSPLFDRRFMHAPGEFNPDVGFPPRGSWWRWWYVILSVIGLVGLVTYVAIGFVWTEKYWAPVT